VSFQVRLDSVETADDALLYRYAALNRMQIPGSGGDSLVRQAFARLQLPGSTCATDPVPREPIVPLTRAIPEVPGGISYSFFSYDVDGSGRPVNIRLLSSSGNRALDLQGDIALGRARFPAQPRSGCLYYFYRYSIERVPPPPVPATADLQPPATRCEDEVRRRVAQLFRMRFPIEFIRRPTEGWAIFTFDVAASGELRNVRIAASEPAARFGEEVLRAATAVRLADVAGSRRGCVSRARFVLPR
jgi:TonB family protein